MNESSLNYESNKPTPEPKLFGRLRLLAGALIGILFFVIILLLLKTSLGSPAYLTLLFPGILAIDMLGLSSNANKVLTDSTAYIVSCLPFSILGSLIASEKKVNRNVGIGLLITYLIFSLCYGLLLVHFMHD